MNGTRARKTRNFLRGALTGVVAYAAAAATAGAASLPLAKTDDGPVRGFVKNGVNTYLGVPYAAPPVGDLRWRPPVRPQSWSTVRDTTKYGNSCVQTYTLGVFAKESFTEDCLYLNVFAPQGGRGARPVMVWIHGGGLVDGRSDDYDGSKLVTDGGVVVVTFNYRLNVFGFMAHPALDAEGHLFANYGLMDQQFALQWVRRNIDKFGGDPKNVTIFGESAGAGSVFANLAAPSSAGLFHRGIAESGGYIDTALGASPTLAAAEQTGRSWAEAVGCSDQSAKCLRSLTVKQLTDKGSSYMTGANFIVDGKLLPLAPNEAIKTGQFTKVPVVNGTNRDELTWLWAITETTTGHVLTAADYVPTITSIFGANAAKVLARYPLSNYSSTSLAVSAAETDYAMACPGRRLSRWLSAYVPTYHYEFADRTAPIYYPAVSFPTGAAHTLEIQYLFPLYHGSQGTPKPLNRPQERLSDAMVDYWTNFAATGSPNSWRTPPWLAYKPKFDLIESLNLILPWPISTFSAEHKCDFWDSLAQSP